MFSGHFLLTAIAALSAAATTSLLGSPVAHATEADDQFLSVVVSLGIEFATPDEAVAAGDNVCDIAAEGSATNIGPAEIRADLINSLLCKGLDAGGAIQLMQGAVNAYCPDYLAVVSD